jgi:hypothetical protein
VTQGTSAAFFSYGREDSDFALQLAGDLKAAGASVWLDQLDIVPGQRWDRAVEDALANCPRMLVILSPASVNSTNVMDEVSFALEEKKTVIPVVYRDCTIPFRLRRVQYVDFRHDYARGLKELRKTLALEQKAGQSTPAISDIPSLSDAINVTEIDQRESTPEAHRRKAAEDATQDDVRHTMPCLLLDMTEVAGPMIRCLLRAAAVGEIPGQQKVCAFHPVSIQNPK